MVSDGVNNATAHLNVSVLLTLDELLGPVAFVSKPTTYLNEQMHFVFLTARHHHTVRYHVQYGDGNEKCYVNIW